MEVIIFLYLALVRPYLEDFNHFCAPPCKKAAKPVKGLEHRMYKRRLGYLGFFRLQKQKG